MRLDAGWVFFWNSRQFIETGDFRKALGGAAPFMVVEESGELIVFGTSRSPDVYLEAIRRFGVANYRTTKVQDWIRSYKRSPA